MTTAITVIATVPVGGYPWGWRSAPTAALASAVTSCSVVASIGFDYVRGPGFSRETLCRQHHSHRPRVMIEAFAQTGQPCRPGKPVGFCS